jgi:hypothetical protein
MNAIALAALTTLAAATPAPDVVVVCPPALQSALGPWLAHRRAEGRVVEVVAPGSTPEAVKAPLTEAFARQPKLNVVLVGDTDAGVPTHLAQARVNVMFGSEPEIATDNWYVDFDDDGVPDAPIGRLPVDTPEELSRLIGRIVGYERSTDVGPWRRRINLVAGVGGFGALADTAIEGAAQTLLTRYLPPAFATTMTYAGATSPYCPGPQSFQSIALGRFNEGCLMWVYMGHGSRREVDRIATPEGYYPILSARDTAALASRSSPPLACFLSCYSGAFDGVEDCLAEEMLRAEGGPIAVLCGSRVALPYAMSILGQELMTAVFERRVETVGHMLLEAKRNSVLRPRDDAESKQFDALATMLMPMAADLDAQRREHLTLFNLLGDPLLKLRHPEAVPLSAPGEAVPGASIAVRGASPIAGRATVELVVRRDRFTFTPTVCDPRDVSPAACSARLDTYRKANDPCLTTTMIDLPAGSFDFDLTIPPEARGDCHVRVYVEGANAFALGSADVRVRSRR